MSAGHSNQPKSEVKGSERVTLLTKYRLEDTIPCLDVYVPPCRDLPPRQRPTGVRVPGGPMGCADSRCKLKNGNNDGQPDVGDCNMHLRRSSYICCCCGFLTNDLEVEGDIVM